MLLQKQIKGERLRSKLFIGLKNPVSYVAKPCIIVASYLAMMKLSLQDSCKNSLKITKFLQHVSVGCAPNHAQKVPFGPAPNGQRIFQIFLFPR